MKKKKKFYVLFCVGKKKRKIVNACHQKLRFFGVEKWGEAKRRRKGKKRTQFAVLGLEKYLKKKGAGK